jgi:hypothetical protein
MYRQGIVYRENVSVERQGISPPLGDSVCSALIARWRVPSLADSPYMTDLKCAVPRVWIDALQSRFWPERDAE